MKPPDQSEGMVPSVSETIKSTFPVFLTITLATPVRPGAAEMDWSPVISSSASSITTNFVLFEITSPLEWVVLMVIVFESPICAAIGTIVLI